jgi:hypothetical protein
MLTLRGRRRRNFLCKLSRARGNPWPTYCRGTLHRAFPPREQSRIGHTAQQWRHTCAVESHSKRACSVVLGAQRHGGGSSHLFCTLSRGGRREAASRARRSGAASAARARCSSSRHCSPHARLESAPAGGAEAQLCFAVEVADRRERRQLAWSGRTEYAFGCDVGAFVRRDQRARFERRGARARAARGTGGRAGRAGLARSRGDRERARSGVVATYSKLRLGWNGRAHGPRSHQ